MLNDNSEKDVEILQKKIGGDYKTFIKQNSKDYMEKLKELLSKGMKEYFDELNNKVNEELLVQETQQKGLHDDIAKAEEKEKNIGDVKYRRNQVLLNSKYLKNDILLKRKALNGIYQNYLREKEIRNRNAFICKILQENKIRKIFKVLKNDSIFRKNEEYEEKTKEASGTEVQKLEKNLNNQRESMMNLIKQAEEKLKHENRKKIQVKLMLDQMVLRGISALNLQAMHLSQNSLKGKIYLLNLIF
jgi:hypothetical protein